MSGDLSAFARTIRSHALRMVARVNASHIGSCLSAADLLAVLYGRVLRVDPERLHWPDRDRFIMSKGHAAAVYYAALAERGFFPAEWLDTYGMDGSLLLGHVSHLLPGVEISTGSLGHGLALGCGLALAGKRHNASWRVFVMLSDGELDEGSTWESILFAGHHQLDNLIAVVDYNKIQSYGRVSEVLELEPLADKWRSFRWSVRDVDGHDIPKVVEALAGLPYQSGRPSVLIAHTTKGRGVSFMEDDLAWHYRSPNPEQLAAALGEIAGP